MPNTPDDQKADELSARIREAEATGARAIVTPCQTCYQGLLNGLTETVSNMKIYHLNELLVQSICPEVAHAKVTTALAQQAALP